MFLIFLLEIGCIDMDVYDKSSDIKYSNLSRFPQKTLWYFDFNETFIEPDIFVIRLKDFNYARDMYLKVYFLNNSNVRIRIQSIKEKFVRWDMTTKDILINQEVVQDVLNYKYERTEEYIKLTCNNYEVHLYNPLLINIYKSDNLILSVNDDSRAVFNFNDRGMDNLVHGLTDVGITFSFPDNELMFSGLSEHALPHILSPTVTDDDKIITEPIRLFNVDAKHYENDSPMALYGSVPYIIAHKGGISTSIFWMNPSETWVDICKRPRKLRFFSEVGYIDFVVGHGSHKDVIDSYTKLTGRPSLHSLFSLTYHQSKQTYHTTKQLRNISDTLDSYEIPHDSIWLDINHIKNKEYFTFHRKRYPDLENFQRDLHIDRRKFITLINPHIKIDDEYSMYEDAIVNKYLLREPSGKPITYGSTIGECVIIDFLNPDANEWFSKFYVLTRYHPSSYLLYSWTDQNEPALTDSNERTAPRDCIHYDGTEHREIHNSYPVFMAASIFRGLFERNLKRDIRPFMLSRSFFSGIQKYSVTWTGGNSASWKMLRQSISMILSSSICGIPYTGSDIGGYFGTPDKDLLVRWYQLGAWVYPFFRCHYTKNSPPREPYELNVSIVKTAIDERYYILPYWYTLAKNSEESGEPIIRPLWWDVDHENEMKDFYETQVMLGDSLLVAPLLDQTNYVIVSIPHGRWYNYRTYEEVTSGFMKIDASVNVPVFIRGGSIIPVKTIWRKTSFHQLNDPTSLIISLNETYEASGRFYVDDGNTYQYRRGVYHDAYFVFKSNKLTCRSYGSAKNINIEAKSFIINGLKDRPMRVILNKQDVQFDYKGNTLLINNVIDIILNSDLELEIIPNSNDL